MASDPTKEPFSCAIFRDPKGGKIEAWWYGADERELFNSDIHESRAAGWSVWAAWQPVWTDADFTQQKLEGWFTDAYGNVRQVGNSDNID